MGDLALDDRLRAAFLQLAALELAAVTLVYFRSQTYRQAAEALATTPAAIADAIGAAMRVVARVVEGPDPDALPT